MTVNLHVLLKIYSASYSWKLQVIPMVPRFAVSQSDVVSFFVCTDPLNWTVADISCLIDIGRKFFDGMVVWSWLSQHITGILRDTHTNYQVMMEGQLYCSEWNDGQNAEFALFELIKRMNLDIKDSACLHVVNILQHPTSRRTTRSTQDTMDNASKKNFSPLPAGKYGKSTKQSTCRRHQPNEGKCYLEAEGVRASGALQSLRSKKMLWAGIW